MILYFLLCVVAVVAEDAQNEAAYKDQFCTDPRTMKKHAAYTEWADAYSCTRHRCQPGGRNLAIYTVGCKRVEAPESAIECEEVVEDTNMQFPYCCTRLRCLVVVRGEVWTRVLGQPWETLPAAPWSHMYKMKKPPPGTTNEFSPKVGNEGPVYELTDSDNDKPKDKFMRSAKLPEPAYNDGMSQSRIPPQTSPDIVIALTTDQKEHKPDNSERKRHKPQSQNQYYEDESPADRDPDSRPREPESRHHEPERKEEDAETGPTEKLDPASLVPQQQPPAEQQMSEEGSNAREFATSYVSTYTNQKPKDQHQRESWPDTPSQWNEKEEEQQPKEISYRQTAESSPAPEPMKSSNKPTHLQALVDAIGSRMRDIENVVQKMSEKVQTQVKPGEQKSDEPEASGEKSVHETKQHSKYVKKKKAKRPNANGEQYKRFTVRNRGSKYLRGAPDGTTEPPVFADNNGYFSDASNSVLRRNNPGIEPKEPAPTYMAPVENRRKAHPPPATSEEKVTKKHRKRTHKKKKKSGKPHKRHHKEGGEKKRKFNRANSVENDRIVISLEDSSAANGNNK
ncbi:triadin-like isoform X2 [Plodia interpunctella]|uniref:triadin-like isoform X2 n=1 Tax=Plodia interpunctella TaxID=58824 RepID=UPI002367CCFA|nr:triadin-like isoform X2 [Plodia interpunctella]